MSADPDEMLALISLRNLRRHLASGVTTLRDNGGRNRVTFVVREAIERGYFAGPRLLLAGRPVTHTHGHFHWCHGVADGADAIRAAIRGLVGEGADHIKLMASGGATSGIPAYRAGYTTDELRVAVETAHQFGRLTTAHCRAADSMEQALAAGLDCIEHGEFLVAPDDECGQPRKSGWETPLVCEYDPRITDGMLRSSTFLSFTMQAGGFEHLLDLRRKREDCGLNDEELALRDQFETYFEIKYEVFGNLLSDGMLPRLVISSDAGPWDGQFGNLHLGLEMAVEAGMRPGQAIEACTRVAAEACGVAGVAGTLESGKDADVLVVEGDPLADIRQMAAVEAVYRQGVRFEVGSDEQPARGLLDRRTRY